MPLIIVAREPHAKLTEELIRTGGACYRYPKLFPGLLMTYIAPHQEIFGARNQGVLTKL